MEAVVTLKATPDDHRTIVLALETLRETALAKIDDKNLDAAERRAQRPIVVKATAILERI